MAYIGKTPASAALTSSDISDGIIITDKLANNAVVTSKITDGTIATADVSDNAINLAKMSSGTDGNIISYDANGNPVAIATGNDGQVLTSTGAGSPPAFENAAAGGKLLKVASDFDSGQITINSTSYTDTGLSISYTPVASNSSLLIFVCAQIYTAGNGSYYGSSSLKVLHDGNNVQEDFTSLSDYQSGAFSYFRTHIAKVDSTGNTNARTIKIQISKGGNTNNPAVLYNQYGGNSSLIVQEIGA